MKILILLIVSVLISSCGVKPAVQSVPEEEPLTVVTLTSSDGSVSRDFSVNIADTMEEQRYGLMFREDLPEGEGMLFIFPESKVLQFWMKNTLIPLDIVYFDADGRFVSSTTMEPCTEDPCPLHSSERPALYALEVPKGTISKHRIGQGWTMSPVKHGVVQDFR